MGRNEGKRQNGVQRFRYSALVCEELYENPCKGCTKRKVCTTLCKSGEAWFREAWNREINALYANMERTEKRVMKQVPRVRQDHRELIYKRMVRNVQFREEKLTALEKVKGRRK